MWYNEAEKVNHRNPASSPHLTGSLLFLRFHLGVDEQGLLGFDEQGFLGAGMIAILSLGLGFLGRNTLIFALDVSGAAAAATTRTTLLLRFDDFLSLLGNGSGLTGLPLLVLVLDLHRHELVVDVGDLLGLLVELLLAGLLVGIAGLAERAGDPELLDIAGQSQQVLDFLDLRDASAD